MKPKKLFLIILLIPLIPRYNFASQNHSGQVEQAVDNSEQATCIWEAAPLENDSLLRAPGSPSDLSLSQKLNSTAKTTDPAERIASFQSIAENITTEDSTRLAKKLVKLIKNLHTLCYDDRDPSIRLSYQHLLETTLANEKLAALDYSGDLTKLLTLYTGEEAPKEPEEAIIGETEEIDEPEVIEVIEEPVDPKQEKIAHLRQNVQSAERESIIPRLTLRKILNDLTSLTRDLQVIENEVKRLSDQNELMTLVYRKLLNIEQALQL